MLSARQDHDLCWGQRTATTSTCFPSSAPVFRSPCTAVSASEGAAAAVVREIPSGTFEHSSAGTAMYSERVPWLVDPEY